VLLNWFNIHVLLYFFHVFVCLFICLWFFIFVLFCCFYSLSFFFSLGGNVRYHWRFISFITHCSQIISWSYSSVNKDYYITSGESNCSEQQTHNDTCMLNFSTPTNLIVPLHEKKMIPAVKQQIRRSPWYFTVPIDNWLIC
jgi:hypothetical protein